MEIFRLKGNETRLANCSQKGFECCLSFSLKNILCIFIFSLDHIALGNMPVEEVTCLEDCSL